ncbi:MAG: helix-turn-helix domain-containing protein [Phycisphaeraceae bacterium]|nr:helix-turn-helix domain-containing protein [Phycisphaeraceae bacterium]
MTDRPEVTDDLYRTGKALAREVAETFGDRRDALDDNWARQHIGDWADTLFLAGWQVWRDKGDVGLAKHRMRDRKKNLLRDVHAELNKPQPESQSFQNDEEQREAMDGGQVVPVRSSGTRMRTPEPDNVLQVQEFLQRLPERRRKIAQLRLAAMTNKEIAQELGIGERTVDREVDTLEKELKSCQTK